MSANDCESCRDWRSARSLNDENSAVTMAKTRNVTELTAETCSSPGETSPRSPALAIASGLQIVRLFFRAIAWRSIVAAAFPDTKVPLGHVTGAYFAGVGVNAITPARAGDVVKLVLVKHEVKDTTYTTLTPTLVQEVLAGA